MFYEKDIADTFFVFCAGVRVRGTGHIGHLFACIADHAFYAVGVYVLCQKLA